MGSEGGKIGYMSGGTTWADTGNPRNARFERYQRGRLVETSGHNKMNIGNRTILDGPAGSLRRAAANRVRRMLSDRFGNTTGWRSGRGPNRIEVRWGRTRAWARPPRRATGMITARGLAGRRQLNSLINSKASRDSLRRQGMTPGTRVRRIGTAPDGKPLYGLVITASPTSST